MPFYNEHAMAQEALCRNLGAAGGRRARVARKDIDYLLANKYKNAVVVVDEAYIHFSENAKACNDLACVRHGQPEGEAADRLPTWHKKVFIGRVWSA